MFFDISFTQLIVSSIYPLLMNIEKSDVLYTKKSVVESLTNKFGFLLVSILLGKTIFCQTFTYNTSLYLSLIVTILASFIFFFISVKPKENEEPMEVTKAFKYFGENKVFYFFLFVSFLGDMIWGSLLGMPLLTLTKNLNFSSQNASYLILGFGIVSNILAIIIVKYLNFKKESINLFLKFGARICLYLIIWITGNKLIFLAMIIYLLITESTHSFIFTSFFINQVTERYSLFFTILRYCVSLIGTAIGTFLCGLVFEYDVKILVLPAFIISIIHYYCALVLLKKKKEIKEQK